MPLSVTIHKEHTDIKLFVNKSENKKEISMSILYVTANIGLEYQYISKYSILFELLRQKI